MGMMWNLWHGCHKVSEGCRNCYVYRRDSRYGIDSSQVRRTRSFRLPVERHRDGSWKVPPGMVVWTCFTSDFFIDEADEWRIEAWRMIRSRPDVHFVIVTKRVERIRQSLPDDWGCGYDNVTLYCTVEDQRQAEKRLPPFVDLPLRHRGIICEPLLGPVDLTVWLDERIEQVTVGGESGPEPGRATLRGSCSFTMPVPQPTYPFLQADGRPVHQGGTTLPDRTQESDGAGPQGRNQSAVGRGHAPAPDITPGR